MLLTKKKDKDVMLHNSLVFPATVTQKKHLRLNEETTQTEGHFQKATMAFFFEIGTHTILTDNQANFKVGDAGRTSKREEFTKTMTKL